jgi:hypothetical protein
VVGAANIRSQQRPIAEWAFLYEALRHRRANSLRCTDHDCNAIPQATAYTTPPVFYVVLSFYRFIHLLL